MLRQQGLEIALTTCGLSDKRSFRKNLRFALDRGLSEDDALAALTTIPARLCDVADRLGTVETGKIANLTVVQGDSYFDPENKVREVWIDGRVYSVDPGARKSAEKDGPANAEAEAERRDAFRRQKEKGAGTAGTPQKTAGPLAAGRTRTLG